MLSIGATIPGSGLSDSLIAQYRDVIEVVSRDERLLHAHVQGPDGQWTRFMTATYKRQ
mgnify:CR=1 FL=1